MKTIKQYLLSESTLLGIAFGAVFYMSYGSSNNELSNYALIFISISLALFSPFYSRISNKIDELACFKTGLITTGRFSRLGFQFLFNTFIIWYLFKENIIKSHELVYLPNLLSTSFLTTVFSQGTQYVAISLANREIGNKNLNIIIAMITSTSIAALSLAGVPEIKHLFIIGSSLIGGSVLILGLLSDIRSRIYPQRGIGIFMGTFNPFHKTHLALIEDAINKRNLSHVYLHPTVIPKIHKKALENLEITIVRREMGMRVYEKTEKADIHVNYFPTGNRFFEFETRCLLAELAIKEANLESKVSVLKLPTEYDKDGFYGVIKEIKKRQKSESIHGIHGSDLGGMWVRSIYDESGWIYPYAVKRVDSVSATAIRNGTRGQASPIVEGIIEHFRQNRKYFSIKHLNFSFEEGLLKNESF